MNGGFRFPPGVRTRPPFPHPLDIMRARAEAARMQQGQPFPYGRPDAHVPRQGDGSNAWDEDGSDRLPPPGWHQNPTSAAIRGVTTRTPENATVRWGDTKELTLPADPLGAQSQALSTYLLAVDLAMPAVGMLRLLVVSPDITAITAGWTCDWKIQTGVGQSMFDETIHVNIAPANGTVRTVILEQVPVQSLRVTATVHVAALTTGPRITVNAQWAPFTAYPDLVRYISEMNREPEAAT